MAGYKTDIDYEYLSTCNTQGVIDYALQNFVSPNVTYAEGFNYRKRVKLYKAICALLQLQPSPEQWLFLLSDCERLLCEACAGAGKTTMAQLKLIDEKLSKNVKGKNILALAYNNHAVKDMVAKHEEIINRINRMDLPELQRDRDLCCSTFHSFCLSWVSEYQSRFGINNPRFLLTEGNVAEVMRIATDAYKKKHPEEKLFISDAVVEALISLNAFSHETLTSDDPSRWKICTAMNDLKDIPTSAILEILDFYTRMKKLKKRMDFNDLVDSMYELCKDPEVMIRIRANYQIFLVDEYQDITPSMLRIIQLIMEGDGINIPHFDEGKLICIGDGDQSIYGFRGTDPDNCIRFRDTYKSPTDMVRITSMSENRRCPSKIIEVARKIIESNDKRIEKPILSIKDGGDINVINYTDEADEMSKLMNLLKCKSPDELKKTCICYRNLSSSYMLTIHMIAQGIPFRFGRGNMPLSDRLSTSIRGVLNMLSYPDNTEYMRENLFRVLPKSAKFTRSAINYLIDEEETRRRSGEEMRRFWELPFDNDTLAITGFSQALMSLAKAYQLHRRSTAMCDYVPQIIRMIRQYYLDWQLQKGTQLSDEYLEYVTSWFSRKISYDTFMTEHKKQKAKLTEGQSNGAYLTTLHGLKGLEFDDVYIIDLNDQLFPGTELNTGNLTDSQKEVVENEARRLFYVAVTRSKGKLTLFFDSECPTRYLRFFKENTGVASMYAEYLNQNNFTESCGFLVADGAEHTSKFDESKYCLDKPAAPAAFAAPWESQAGVDPAAYGFVTDPSSNTVNIPESIPIKRDLEANIPETQGIPWETEDALTTGLEDTLGADELLDDSVPKMAPAEALPVAPEDFVMIPGLDDLTAGLDDPTLSIDLESSEAIQELTAGKPGLLDKLVLNSLDMELTVEQEMQLKEVKGRALEKQIGADCFETVANKPNTLSILGTIMERGI